jgi:hypothetical protein
LYCEHDVQLAFVLGSARPGQVLDGGGPASFDGGVGAVPHAFAFGTHTFASSPVAVVTVVHVCLPSHSFPFGHGFAQYVSPPICEHEPPPVQSSSVTHGGHVVGSGDVGPVDEGVTLPPSLPSHDVPSAHALITPASARPASPTTTVNRFATDIDENDVDPHERRSGKRAFTMQSPPAWKKSVDRMRRSAAMRRSCM